MITKCHEERHFTRIYDILSHIKTEENFKMRSEVVEMSHLRPEQIPTLTEESVTPSIWP